MALDLLRAFLIGGGICIIGQLLFDIFKLTPAHTMCALVAAGSLLGGLGWYPKLAEYAGFGASLPISSFGNTLVKGALEGASQSGFWGIFSGMMGPVSAGISAAVVFAFLAALFFRPQS